MFSYSKVLTVLAVLVLTSILLPTFGAAKSVAPPGHLYIVRFQEAPLATYDGDVAGLEATSPRAQGQTRLDAKSPASQAYLSYLEQRQEAHLERISSRIGRSAEPVFRYLAAVNGVALKLSGKEAAALSRMPGIAQVIPDRLAVQDTDRGPLWIGAPAIWDGTSTPGFTPTRGEGIVIGVIDSGVNMDHPSFAATDGDGFTHTNPNGAGVFVGWCDPLNPNFDPSYLCNDKLIGGWDYTDAYCAANPATCTETDGPEDDNGHGSHTAGTAAGNKLTSPDIVGVAPRANIISYDVCYTDPNTGQGLCPFSATSAAVDQAILDGVDATNYSISGGSAPWSGDIDTFFLGAVAAGIFPAASAGNAGPGASTVAHLGPWMMTVAASTHDRVTVANSLINMSGGMAPPANIDGASRTAGYGPETIVYAGNFSNGDPNPEQCLNPFPGGTWTSGEIVVCDRGSIARVLKCANVAAGGAAGCVLANTTAGQGAPVADPHVIPAVHVDDVAGTALRAWLSTGAGHTATITDSAVVTDPAVADVMAGFSSRGPNLAFDGLKPDVTNPGVSVFAAFSDGSTPVPPEFGTISGTSMSSPHTAGSGALVAAVHPDWTPSEIKSALMMTADTTVLKEDGVTDSDPFDRGAGRVDLTKAALALLVLDESAANYEAADPANGGDPSTLNVASYQNATCVTECSWTRTVTSAELPEGGGIPWTVNGVTPPGMSITADPSAFNISSGADQVITFTADVSGMALDTWTFSEVEFTTSLEGGIGTLSMPAAIRPALENFPDEVAIESLSSVDSETLLDRKSALAITALDIQASGMTLMTPTPVTVDQDPTNGDPYDDLSQVFVKTITVDPNARLLRVLTSSLESPDVDLYVGTGATPSAATETCVSATATATESCDIENPVAGTYWVLVQNWFGSTSQPDLIDLLDGIIYDTDAGNLSASGPPTAAAGQEFDLDVSWDVSAYSGGDTWFGILDFGTDGGNAGNLGSTIIQLHNPGLFGDGFESGDTMRWSNTSP